MLTQHLNFLKYLIYAVKRLHLYHSEALQALTVLLQVILSWRVTAVQTERHETRRMLQHRLTIQQREGLFSVVLGAAKGPFGSPPCTFTGVISASGGRWPLAVSHSVVTVSVVIQALSSEALRAGSFKWHKQIRMSTDTHERAYIQLKYMHTHKHTSKLGLQSHSMSQLSSSVNSETQTIVNIWLKHTHTHTQDSPAWAAAIQQVTAERQCKHISVWINRRYKNTWGNACNTIIW